MRKLSFIIAFVFATCAYSVAQNNEQPRVEISGMAKVKVIPDRAEIEITLRESDNKGKFSLKELEDKLAIALKAAGVDAKKQLSLYRQSLASAKRRNINQFKTFKLEVYTAEEAQDVMDALQENNISNARLTKVWIADRNAISDSLKVEAIQKAKADATTLAEALGQTVGSAYYINYYPSRPTVVYRNVMLKSAATMDMAVEESAPVLPEINFDEIEIEENVSVKFILNPIKE